MNQEPIMYQLIASFPSQIKEAVQIADKINIQERKISNIILSGMGGSGIGASIVKELTRNYSPFPIEVIKDYHVPAYCGNETLFIASSYSGNTEETLQAVNQALKMGACVKTICSSGKLKALSIAHHWDCITIPEGLPPRAGLAYSFVALCHILKAFGAIPDLRNSLLNAADELDKKQQDIKTQALQIARKIAGKPTAIYSVCGFAGVAVRLAQQLHENAKQHAWVNSFPELNHNELVSWNLEAKQLAVIVIRAENSYERTLHRVRFSEKIIQPLSGSYTELLAEGSSELIQALYVIHLGDFISWYASVENQVDSMDIRVIENLKKSLESI